jgi:TetR/AcrR family transcriptional regulator
MSLSTIPASTTRRERRKDARPGELLDAALELFAEKGFAATRSEEVAQRAGVSKGTLFLYFPTKEDLLKAVVRETVGGQVRQGADEVRQWTGSTESLLRLFIAQWWARYGSTKASGITKLVLSEGANFPDIAQFYRDEVITPGHELVSSVIQRGITCGEFRPVDLNNTVHCVMAPLIFLVMWKHAMAPCCGPDSRIDPLAFLEQHADLMVRGLLSPSSPQAL